MISVVFEISFQGKIYPIECRFQGIAKTDKKTFFNEQHKKIEGNSRMGKIRALLERLGKLEMSREHFKQG